MKSKAKTNEEVISNFGHAAKVYDYDNLNVKHCESSIKDKSILCKEIELLRSST